MPLGDLADAVTTVSALIPKAFLPPGTIEEIVALTQKTLVEEALRGFPTGTQVTVRDLRPTDLGLTNGEWTETSSTDNSFTAMAVSAKSIADETYVAIYGIGMLSLTILADDLIAKPPISAIRITVGASKVAQWSVYPLWKNTAYVETSTSDLVTAVFSDPLYGILQSPIIIGKNGVITMEMYNIEETIVFKPIVLGFVCEKQGKTFNP
ncbi:MAG: hypothetical protein Q8P23_00865 [bacterium]|nr:hypothetical protein [bacterium]